MKHAGPESLARLAPLLQRLRGMAGLQERRPGIFYRRGGAFLHFHEDPAGLFADAKLEGRGFQRFAVDTDEQQAQLLQSVRQMLSA
jgi:hypothetical protein